MSTIDDLKARGFNVIPLKEKSKEPIVGLNWKKFQDEKYDGSFPENCNFAIICGNSSGNLFVVDCDDFSLYDEFPEELLRKSRDRFMQTIELLEEQTR